MGNDLQKKFMIHFKRMLGIVNDLQQRRTTKLIDKLDQQMLQH